MYMLSLFNDAGYSGRPSARTEPLHHAVGILDALPWVAGSAPFRIWNEDINIYMHGWYCGRWRSSDCVHGMMQQFELQW